MKSTKRFLVLLLAFALAASCFAVFALASEAEEEYNYLDMLEYYETGHYVNEHFNTEGLSQDTVFADSSKEFALPEAGVAFTHNAEAGTGVFGGGLSATVLTVTPESVGNFGLNMKAKNISGGRGSSIRLQLVNDLGKYDYIDVFAVYNNTLEYATVKADPDTGKLKGAVETVTDTAFADDTDGNGAFFTVEFFYDKLSGNKASFTVNGVDYALDLGSYSYKQVRLIFTSCEFDYLEMYSGSFQRRLVDFENDVAEHLVRLYDLYWFEEDEDNIAKYIEAGAKVLGLYGLDLTKVDKDVLHIDTEAFSQYTPDRYMDDINTFTGIALKEYGNLAAERFVTDTDKLAGITDYGEKLALYTELYNFEKIITTIETVYSEKVTLNTEASLIEEKRALLAEAYEWLETEKANTVHSFETVKTSPDPFSATYKELYDFYQLYKDYPICETYFDETHSASDVKAAYLRAETLKSEFLRLDSMAKIFAENVPVAADTDLTFGERYVAFEKAKNNVFTDSTYDEFLTDTTVALLNEAYNSIKDYFTVPAETADKFLAKMNEAKATMSYSVMESALDEAEPYLSIVEPTYPGVAEAKTLYTELRQKISDAKTAAEDYIKAVLAVRAATTVADKKAAIAIAKEKGVLGNDVSLDVSVVEGEETYTVLSANVILSDEESKIVLEETKNANFIKAVEAIETKTTLAEKRAAIFKAIELQETADKKINEVSNAIADLSAAIDAFNAEVNAANNESDECTEAAATVVEKTVLTKTAADIVAIIKKLFD